MWQLILKIVLLAWVSHVNALSVDVHEGLHWPVTLAGQLRLLEDKTHALDVKDVQAWASEPAGQSHETKLERRQSLPPSSAWWLAFTVSNTRQAPMTLRFLPGTFELDRIDYYLESQGHWAHTVTGRRIPVSAQNADTAREQALVIELPAGGKRQVLMRIQNSKKFTLHPTLYAQSAYFLAEEHDNLLIGMLFGGLMSVSLCSLILAFYLQSGALGVLSALGAVTALYEASLRGYAKLYLWPEATDWAARAPHALGHTALAIFLLFLLRMTKSERHHPLARRFIMLLSGIQACLALASLHIDLGSLEHIVAQIALLYAIILPIAALLLMRRSSRSLRLLILTSAFFFAHTLLRALERSGLFTDQLRWIGLDNPGTHPLVALAGMAVSFPLLTMWFIQVHRRSRPARPPLAPLEPQDAPRAADMLSYIGHDLRAPLATIAGYVRLIKQTETPEQAPHVRAIERSVNYQLVLIDELLECAKSDLPLAVRPTQVATNDFLDEIAGYAAALSSQQNNVFEAAASSALPAELYMDETRLKQVLLNLLSNAAKFTRDGTIRLNVEASITARRCTLEFSVIDSGVGIAPQSQAAIFRPYNQLRATPGSVGLGLHIARNLIEKMGGVLHVESAPGKGSRFYFEVSLDIADARPALWRGADSKTRLGSAASRPGAGDMPQAGLRQLATLAQAGELSHIEDWLSTAARTYPQASGFLGEVGEALRRLDFKRIEALAQASASHQ